MATVGVDDSSPQADSQHKSVGLVYWRDPRQCLNEWR